MAVVAGVVVAIAAASCAPSSTEPPAASRPPLATSAPPPAASSGSPAAATDRVTGWRADLQQLVPGMARIHPNLEHGTPRSELDSAVAALEAAVPSSTDDQLMVGVLNVVARVSAAGCDGHTGAFIWGTGSYPVESLPLRLWWFDEGLVIVDALPPYRDLVGSRIEGIDSHPVAAVVAAIEPLVPRDNAATVRLLLPRYILMPQVLRGLGLAGPGAVDLRLAATASAPGTASQSVTVEPVPMATYNAWAGPYGLHLPVDPVVTYLSRIDEALWWKRLDGGTLFVQYNRVDRLPGSLIDQLGAAVRDPAVTRVVVDIRHNFGGEVSAIDSLVGVFRAADVDQAGRLYLVTGRNTFSAASLFAARLEAATTATVTGEPMGGCPTAYGDSSDFRLSHSGIVVSVAGMLEVGISADDPRMTIDPELPARLTPAAWAAGVDPALEAIARVP